MLKMLPSPLRERLRRDEPLSRHTTFRIGGPADLFLTVQTEEELIAAVRWAREENLPYLLLGGGSNVLVADKGVRGLVIANRCGGSKIQEAGGRRQEARGKIQEARGKKQEAGGKKQEAGGKKQEAGGKKQEARGEAAFCILHVASCVPLSRLARYAIRRGLAGLEWAVGIPGTVGGAIVGNAGAHGGCMADSLISVRVLDADGEVRELAAAELGFGYRSSVLRAQRREGERGERREERRREGQRIILSAQFALRAGNRQEL